MIPPAQNFCSSDLGMVPLRDVNVEIAREHQRGRCQMIFLLSATQ